MLLAALTLLLIGITLGIWAASLVLRVLDEHLAALGRRWFPSLKPRRAAGTDSTVVPVVVRPWQRWFAIIVGTLAMMASPVILRQAYLFGTENALGIARGSLWDWWLLGAALCSTLAIASLLLALRFDTPRGRRRCGKCWYDYTGLTDTAACPECGRVSKNAADLRRTRGHRGMGWLTVLLLIVSLGLWRTPAIMTGGLIGAVPTTVLIASIGIVPPEWTTQSRWGSLTDQEILRRLKVARPWGWQSELTRRRLAAAAENAQQDTFKASLFVTMLSRTLERRDLSSHATLNRILASCLKRFECTDIRADAPVQDVILQLGQSLPNKFDFDDETANQWLRLLRQHEPRFDDAAAAVLANQPRVSPELCDELLSYIGRSDNPPGLGQYSTWMAHTALNRAKVDEAYLDAAMAGPSDSLAKGAMRVLAFQHSSKIKPLSPERVVQWLKSPSAPRVTTAFEIARSIPVDDDQNGWEGLAREFARQPGPNQLDAIQYLATVGLLDSDQQMACVGFISAGTKSQSQRAATCLYGIDLLHPDAVRALKTLRDSGAYGNMPGIEIRSFLELIITRIYPPSGGVSKGSPPDSTPPATAPPQEPTPVPR